MKKGTKIQVTNSAKYNGKDMSWTETFTGQKMIGKGGEIVTHVSDRMIEMFAEKEICVHPQEHSESYFSSNCEKSDLTGKFSWPMFVYSIHLPEGFVVDTYSEDEYRFELREDMDVFFAGIVTYAKSGQKISQKTGRLIDTYIQYSDTIIPE
jgi:hypothetical protein